MKETTVKEKGIIEKGKDWVVTNKWKILAVLGLAGAAVVTGVVINNNKNKEEEQVALPEFEGFDSGREVQMHFVDPTSNEVLWKEICSEGYMNEIKESGMEVPEIRELNNVGEEA